MQLAYAYICVDCEDIFDAREIANGQCPRCMSKTIWPLTAWVPTAKNITVAALKNAEGRREARGRSKLA